MDPDKTQPVYSTPEQYWYNSKSGMVYDYDIYYPVGQIEFVDGLPNKLDKYTYIMSTVINIPSIANS